MKVRDVMSEDVFICNPDDNLATAALRMWNHDCGVLPVVERGRVRGVITDRDICMALALKGQPPAAVRVAEVIAGPAVSCVPGTDVAEALEIMRDHQVHRLPVVEDGRLAGLVSLNDLALAAGAVQGIDRRPTYREVVDALQGICAHRRPALAA
jgi:CBS domain-containing protein